MACDRCKHDEMEEEFPCPYREMTRDRGKRKYRCKAQISRTFGNPIDIKLNSCKWCLFRETLIVAEKASRSYVREKIMDYAPYVSKPTWCQFGCNGCPATKTRDEVFCHKNRGLCAYDDRSN